MDAPFPRNDRLRDERERRNWTQAQVAELLNIDPKTVSRWECGKSSPSFSSCDKLCKLYKKNLEELGLIHKGKPVPKVINSSESVVSHLHNAGRIENPLEEQRSAVPRQQAFYGREKELEQLRHLILGEPAVQCLAILGIGGVGKTSITIELVERIKGEFEYFNWYSFQTPAEETFSNIMTDCLRYFSKKPAKDAESDTNSKLESFITCLEKHRCLLILDNFESLLKSGSLAGEFADGYKEYGKLLNLVCSRPRRSCLILTSREKPDEVALQEGMVVKSWLLSGVEDEDARKILRDKGLMVKNDAWRRLAQLYSGNPFALQLASAPIRDVFGGDIEAFLNSLEEKQEKVAVVSVVHDLLAQQFQRLSDMEKEVMYWLAIEREPVHMQKLREDILQIAAKPDLLNVLESLLRRSLIERKNVTRFGLQPLVMEYMTNQLVQGVYEEIDRQQIVLLESHALIKAETEDYVRREQMRCILAPLKEKLLANFNRQEIEDRLQNLLTTLREEGPQKSGYTAGNILNLLLYLDYDPRGYDFSSLTVRQAYLREKGLREVNFAHANLSGSVFTDTFGSVLSVALSPDGKLLAAGMANAEVRIWQMEKRTLLHTCRGHTDWVRSVAFSADGKIVASGSHDRTIRLWDVDTGQCTGIITEHENRVRAVTFGPVDEKPLLASSSDDKTIRIWDIQTRTCLYVLPGHCDKVNAIAFSPDDHTLVSVSHDETIRVWDVDGGYLLKELRGHGGWIWSVAFSSDGNTLACGNEDGTISLWNMHSYHCFQTLTGGHSARVNTVAFSPRRDILVSGSDDETIQLWNVGTGRSQPLVGHINGIRSVSVSYDGSIIVSGSDDETVRIWDANNNQRLYTLQGYSSWVYSVAFNSAASPLLASGGEDMRVRLWDARTGERLLSLHGHTHRVRAVTFSSDNSKIASASDDQTVRIWEVETGLCLSLLRGHKVRLRSVAFSPDNSKIASASDDQTVRIWEVETGMWIATLPEHSSRVYSVAWSRDGNFLASSSEDEKICLWDARTYELLRVFSGHKGRVYAVSFSPDSAFLVSGGSDLIVRLWEVSTGTCVREMRGHSRRICSVAYSPDGQMLASASDDRTTRLWSATTGELLRTISGHSSRVCSVAFFDKALLSTGSYDGTIKLWNPQTGEQVSILRSERPYERMNITDIRGLTAAQKAMLKILGAEEESKSEGRTL